MINIDLKEDSGIAVVRPSGSLTQQDFATAASQLDPYIEQHGSLQGLVICAESFPGWRDFGSLLSHLRFVHDHHRQIKKVAAVSDSTFLTIMPKVVAHFVKAEVRHFDADQFEEALAWVTSKGAENDREASRDGR